MPSHQTHINDIGLTDNHNIALCNDPTVHMVPLPSAEPSEVNAVETIARLILSQIHEKHPNNICTQSTYSNSTLTNNNTNSSPQNNTIHPHDQSTVVLHQFSMVTWELRNFTDKVSCDITKIHKHEPQLKKTLAN